MKKVLLAAAAVIAMPAMAKAQDVQTPGVYLGVEGGLNWMFNTTILNQNVSPYTGWALGGKIGYDFLGPRVEVEGLYRENNNSNNFGNRAITNQISQVTAMVNLLYDFNAGGSDRAVHRRRCRCRLHRPPTSNLRPVYTVRLPGASWASATTSSPQRSAFNLEGRYIRGTTNPYGRRHAVGYNNNNISLIAEHPGEVRRGRRRRRRRRRPVVTRAVVHGVLRLGPLEPLAAGADHDPAGGRRRSRRRASARITATGHTDTSGPESYNMALSLRRANAVKDALVRDGVPAAGDLGHRQGREPAAGADRRQRARAAEPPRRDRHPVRRSRGLDYGTAGLSSAVSFFAFRCPPTARFAFKTAQPKVSTKSRSGRPYTLSGCSKFGAKGLGDP